MVGYDGHRGWIYSLAVKPDLQRKGIGSQMMEHAENWLRQHGCPRAKLQIDEARGDVAGFYRKLGYEVQPLVSMAKWFRVAE
jgi:ribosomal protein S18 acetylase RimI-like enzyme